MFFARRPSRRLPNKRSGYHNYIISSMIRQIVVVAFISISPLVISCHHAAPKVETPRVAIVEVERQFIADRQRFIGSIAANFEAVIQPRVQGFLASSLFDNGMPVRRGELIFTLDGGEQRAAQLSAKAALASARAKVVEAKNSYDRAVPLAAINAISRAQLDQYTASYEAAKAAVQSAEQQLVNASLAVGYTRIYSPIDGIISTSAAHIGDYVGPGTRFATLTTIQNIDTVAVDVAISMRRYLASSGRTSLTYDNRDLLTDIRLYKADGSEYPHRGFYKFTRSSVPNDMGAMVIVVGFPNPEYALKAGQFARVEANVGRGSECVVVPITAIASRQGVSNVWVCRPDSTVEYRRVVAGEVLGNRRIILEGLAAGEHITLIGAERLRNNQRIMPSKGRSNE